MKYALVSASIQRRLAAYEPMLANEIATRDLLRGVSPIALHSATDDPCPYEVAAGLAVAGTVVAYRERLRGEFGLSTAAVLIRGDELLDIRRLAADADPDETRCAVSKAWRRSYGLPKTGNDRFERMVMRLTRSGEVCASGCLCDHGVTAVMPFVIPAVMCLAWDRVWGRELARTVGVRGGRR